jgi:hypothetical protein
MELAEVIKSSLSIFSTTAIVFVTISYTIFKIKGLWRIKPYLSISVQKPSKEVTDEQAGDKVNIKMEEKPAEEKQLNKLVLVKLPIQNKFTIVRGEVIVDKLKKPEQEKEDSTLLPNDSKKNIYDIFASPNEKMHRLKVGAR